MRKTKKDFKNTWDMLEYAKKYQIPIKTPEIKPIVVADITISEDTLDYIIIKFTNGINGGTDWDIKDTIYDLDYEAFDKWNSDFTDAKVGDEVWYNDKKGRISRISYSKVHPIVVEFENTAINTFTKKGLYYFNDKQPSLFKINPNIFNEKGKEMEEDIFKVGNRVYYEDYHPIYCYEILFITKDYFLGSLAGTTTPKVFTFVEFPKNKWHKQVAKKYRPFANAKEFEPHRDRWIKHKTISPDRLIRVLSYGNAGAEFQEYSFRCYETLFHEYVFEDGTPCGVEE